MFSSAARFSSLFLYPAVTQRRAALFCLQFWLPELSKASGTTWSLFLSAIQHQAGCRRLDPGCKLSFCCCGCPCQKQRLWMSDLMRVCAANCSVNSRELQLGLGCQYKWEEQRHHTAGIWRNYPITESTHLLITYLFKNNPGAWNK